MKVVGIEAVTSFVNRLGLPEDIVPDLIGVIRRLEGRSQRSTALIFSFVANDIWQSLIPHN